MGVRDMATRFFLDPIRFGSFLGDLKRDNYHRVKKKAFSLKSYFILIMIMFFHLKPGLLVLGRIDWVRGEVFIGGRLGLSRGFSMAPGNRAPETNVKTIQG